MNMYTFWVYGYIICIPLHNMYTLTYYVTNVRGGYIFTNVYIM